MRIFFGNIHFSFFNISQILSPLVSAGGQELSHSRDNIRMITASPDDPGSLLGSDQALVLNTLLYHLRGDQNRPGSVCRYKTGIIEAEFQRGPSRLMQAWVSQSISRGS